MISSGRCDIGPEASFQEVSEGENTLKDADEEKTEFLQEVDTFCENYLRGKQVPEKEYENPETEIHRIKCRNQDLAGKVHPETGVPFQERELVLDGERCRVVVPEFQSVYEAKLPPELYRGTYAEQFRECSNQLKEDVEKDPALKERFTPEQLEQIQNGDIPEGYTWHHDGEPGHMQLVDTEIHRRTAHTGGMAFWGSGRD